MAYTKGVVSVVIPTFGRSDYICNTIESVLTQTYDSIEIVIVDDNGLGSENQKNTYKNIIKYINKRYKLTYVPLDKNSGGSVARNIGAKIAQGEYLCFLDDDDEFLPEKVSKQVDLLLQNPYFVGCYCSHIRRFTDVETDKYYISNYSGELLYPLLMFQIDICSGSSLMLPHWTFDKINGFTPDMRRMQDYEFVARLAFFGKIGVVSEPELIINVHKGSYRIKNFEVSLQTRKRYLEIVCPLFVKLSRDQKTNVIVNLHVQNIVDAVKFRCLIQALILFCNSENMSRTILFLFKRLFKKL